MPDQGLLTVSGDLGQQVKRASQALALFVRDIGEAWTLGTQFLNQSQGEMYISLDLTVGGRPFESQR